MATLVGGRQRDVDLLPDDRRPARSRARAALDHPAAREAADGRRVLVQEVDRPAVPLPRQLARPHRELPAHDVRGADGAVRGQPDRRARAEAAADPARRPRAELLDVDGAPRRLLRREPLRVDRGRHRRAVGSAARRREPGRDRDARGDPRQRRRRADASSRGPRIPTTTSASPASGTACTRTTTRAPASSRPPPSACSHELGSKDSLFDIALELEQVALTDEYFIEQQAVPERRLLLGPHLPGDGLPHEHVPGAVRDRPPARLDRALEGRPRERRRRRSGGRARSTPGPTERKYVPIEQREDSIT